MGTFTVQVRLVGDDGHEGEPVDAVVDTGATHTLLPGRMLAELGVRQLERVAFQLEDERTVEYAVGEIRLGLDDRWRTALVIFGPGDATPLLGATTLELFNLAADPVRRRLVPVSGLLKNL